MGVRNDLIEVARDLLARAGFAVSERCDVRPISFDVVARRDGRLLLLKILGNADALNGRVAHELRLLARFLKASPLLVAERDGSGPLEDGVVYRHREIPCITLGTLQEHLLANAAPLAFASPGGVYVHLRREVLRLLRAERDLSLGAVAAVAGVSRRAIQMYEEGMRATVESALRLEEFFGASLVEPIDPFGPSTPEDETPTQGNGPARERPSFESAILGMLRSVGFQVVPTPQSPFSALSQDASETILTGVERRDTTNPERARVLAHVRSVAETDAMYVVRRETTRVVLEGTPVVHERELERLRDPDDLVNLLNERRPRAPPA